MMIEQHRARPYIENLRRDPRTRAMFDGWIAQANIEAEQRFPDRHDDRERAHYAAEQALALAMSFVLDNDGEYQMVCKERDQLMDGVINGLSLAPMRLVVSKDA